MELEVLIRKAADQVMVDNLFLKLLFFFFEREIETGIFFFYKKLSFENHIFDIVSNLSQSHMYRMCNLQHIFCLLAFAALTAFLFNIMKFCINA